MPMLKTPTAMLMISHMFSGVGAGDAEGDGCTTGGAAGSPDIAGSSAAGTTGASVGCSSGGAAGSSDITGSISAGTGGSSGKAGFTPNAPDISSTLTVWSPAAS